MVTVTVGLRARVTAPMPRFKSLGSAEGETVGPTLRVVGQGDQPAAGVAERAAVDGEVPLPRALLLLDPEMPALSDVPPL